MEAQKFAYAQRTLLADPKFVKEAEELSVNMTSKRFTDEIIAQIKDRAREPKDYGADTAQVSISFLQYITLYDFVVFRSTTKEHLIFQLWMPKEIVSH